MTMEKPTIGGEIGCFIFVTQPPRNKSMYKKELR